MNISLSKGGIMKIFKGLYNHQIIVISLLLSCSVFAWYDEPSAVMAAYNNKISHILYSAGSDDQYAITLVSEHNPICIYTPLLYEDSQDTSLTKTYFLPRMRCSDHEMRYFYEDLEKNLKRLGVELRVDEVKGINYGLQISFTMQSADVYDIIKVIDADRRMVRFEIVTKI